MNEKWLTVVGFEGLAVREIRKILKGNEPEIYYTSPLSEQEEVAWVHFKAICYWIFLALLVFAVASCLKGCEQPAWSAEIPQNKAIRVIVGEASNQGFIGMVCVAEVLRHKGSTNGFYGLNAKHSDHEPKWVWIMAKKAWYASKTTSYTRLADHFENIHAFGCPYWIKYCIETFRYRDHVFYKEVKRA